MAWQNNSLMNRLIFSPLAVKQGQWYRFITHGFVHADGTHLLFNMFTLYFFGRAVENFFNRYLGGLGFIAIYLIAIVVAMLPSYFKHKNDMRYRSLGASGGVSAVLFSFILMAPWSMLYLFAVIPIPAIVFAIAYVAYSIHANNKGNSNINHLAHLWGGAFGVVATILLSPNVLLHFLHELMHPRF
nr:rhomboid family intramembrane serine protease [Psychrobacter lutiphocae]